MFLDNNDIRIWVNDYLSSKISKDDLNQLIKFKIKEGFDLLTKGQKWYNNFKNQ
jgi:arsenate reductase-like glutaredoxin family protein